jgi:transposase
MDVKFTLADIYRALERIAGFEVGLQRHLNGMVKEFVGRDLSHAFYDVTNYFFEIDFPDGDGDLRQRGVSKEHRVDPIIGMGLFMDSNGLPVCMSIFPGNRAESTTLNPVIGEVKESYGLGRLVVIADKGLNSSGNIDRIVNGGDGFVFSQVLKGTKGRRYHDRMFDTNGYIEDADGSYRHKLFDEEYEGRDADGRKVTRKRKVLIYWCKAEADMARRKLEEKLRRAERAVRNGVYGIKKGVDEYVREDVVVKSVDMAKARGDARYDGYHCIVTSELDYGEAQIRAAYGGLWRIEQSFRVMKSDLYARPVFVWKAAHIRAHFLVCFTALLLVRVIQHRMGGKALPAERLSTALSAATCQVLKGGIVHLDDVGGEIAFKQARDKKGELVDTLEFSDEDRIALDYKLIQDTFGTDFYNIYPKQEVFNRFLKNIALA